MKPVRFKIIEEKEGFKVILNGIKYPRDRGKLYLKKLNDISLHSTKVDALNHAYFSDNRERDNIIRDIEIFFNWTGEYTGYIKR